MRTHIKSKIEIDEHAVHFQMADEDYLFRGNGFVEAACAIVFNNN